MTHEGHLHIDPKNTENTDFHTITSRYTFSLVLKKAHLGNSGTFYMLLQMIFGNSPEKICLVIFIPMLKPNALGLLAIQEPFSRIVRP